MMFMDYRRRTLAGMGMFCLLLLSACSVFGGGNTSATPSAQDLLHNAQAAILKVTAYHFNLVAQNPGSSGLLTITSADGDIVVPDKLKADTKALAFNNTVAVKIVAIGSKQYITDPITGQWRVVKGVLNASSLTNPNTGIVSLSSKLQDVTGPTSDVVNGIPCWRVNGLLDAKYIAFLTGGGVPAGTMLQTSVCAGQSDGLPYQLSVVGQAAKSDTTQTSRTFNISGYNEHTTITAPQI